MRQVFGPDGNLNLALKPDFKLSDKGLIGGGAMIFKYSTFFFSLMVIQVKAHAHSDLRSKVLNALHAKSELAEVKVTQSDSKTVQNWKYTLSDLNPETLIIEDIKGSHTVEKNELFKLGINADILSYSFFNTEIPRSFGIDKKYHITYTAVKTAAKDLSHFLVYYDKKNFYPVKVTYFNGNKKIATVEYLDYKKIKNQIWRANVITAENHLSQKRTRLEFTKTEVNPDSSPIRMGSDRTTVKAI